MTAAPVRLSVAGPARPALVGIAALAALVVGIEAAFVADAGSAYLWLDELQVLIGAVYAAAGLTAWWRRPNNRLGPIIVAAASVWMLTVLVSAPNNVLACVGVVMATVPLAMLAHMLLAFPSGRLRSPAARLSVGIVYATSLVLQVPLYLFRPEGSPDGWLSVSDSPNAHGAGVLVQNLVGLAGMVLAAWILVVRLRRASPAQRKVLAPVYLFGVVAVLVVPLTPYVLSPITELTFPQVFGTQLFLIGSAPVVFVVAVLLGGFARTAEISQLGSWLADAPVHRSSLEMALAQTLGDPSLRLGYWSPALDRFVDDGGAALPRGAGRAALPVEVHGEPVAEISYDPVRNEDPALVHAAGRVVALAIEQERLTSELRASEHALQVAGRRIVEAGDRERSRIAQDLHDGMQAQLVAIALGAQQIARHTDSTPEIQATATRLWVAIDMSARELRTLVHDILPAALIERGLADAVEDLTDRIDLPIVLDTGELSHPMSATTQRTGYFVVAECLTNAARHAQAKKVVVQMRQTRSALHIEVSDDGVGGARVGPGLGLRGLADRVELLGGRLTVTSSPGDGTQVRAELPCES